MAPPALVSLENYSDVQFRDVIHRRTSLVAPTANVLQKLYTHLNGGTPQLSAAEAITTDGNGNNAQYSLLLSSGDRPLSADTITTANLASWTANSAMTINPNTFTVRSRELDVKGSARVSGNLNVTSLTDVFSGANYTWATSSAPVGQWQDVVYGNGLYVAVGSLGGSNTAMTSTDGISWTARSAPRSAWLSIAYGNGVFASVSGDASTMYSSDGITWAYGGTPLGDWLDVAFGNGIFVAVSPGTYSSYVMTSTNGAAWTLRTPATTNAWQSVTFGNGIFVAVANSGTGNRVMTSSDGLNWTSRTSAADKAWVDVVYGNGTFVAAASDGIMTSTDGGVTWTLQTATVGTTLGYAAGLFVALSSSTFHTSGDGITWALGTAPVNANSTGIAYGGDGRFVAVSSDGTAMASNLPTENMVYYNAGSGLLSKGPLDVPTAKVGSLAVSKGVIGSLSVNGNVSADYYAGTLSTAAQPNITSLGTLSRLNVDNTANTAINIGSTKTLSVTKTLAQASGNVVEFCQITGSNLTFVADLFVVQGETGKTCKAYTFCVSTFGAASTRTNGEWHRLVPKASGQRNDGIAVEINVEDSLLATAKLRLIRTTSTGTGPGIECNLHVHYSRESPVTLTELNTTAMGITPSTTLFQNTLLTQYRGNVGIGTDNPTDLLTVAGKANVQALTCTSGNVLLQKMADVYSAANYVWTPRTGAPASAWSDIVYGNGLYVAVAKTGTDRIMSSLDGITWTARTAPSDSSWTAVTFGNGLFVAVANDSAVATSPDGITWTSQTPSNFGEWVDVTYGNGIFVAVATAGPQIIMTSPDGVNWTGHDSGTPHPLSAVTYGDGLFVAVSAVGTGDRVITSTNGSYWLARTSAADNSWYDVAYGAGLFVAVSSDGADRVMTSPNGVDWTLRNAVVGENLVYMGGLFVAISLGTGVHTSVDGINWTFRSAVPSEGWRGIAYNDGRFVAVADTGAGVLTWDLPTKNMVYHNTATGLLSEGPLDVPTAKVGSLAVSEAATVTGILSVNGNVGIGTDRPTDLLTVAGTANVQALTCTSGNVLLQKLTDVDSASYVWTSRTNPVTSTWSDVAYASGMGKYAAVSSSDDWNNYNVLESSDGTTWTSVDVKNDGSVGTNNRWTSVTTNGTGTKFVAVASTDSFFTSLQVMYYDSQDLSPAWKSAATPPTVGGEVRSWQSVTWGNGVYVAVANAGTTNQRVMTSTDGETGWTIRTSAADNAWQGVCWGKDKFVAVASSGVGNRVMTSQDGLTWTARTSAADNDWRSVCWGNGLFVAVANSGTGNRVMTSPDGLAWTTRTSAADYGWSRVIYGKGLFVAVADSGSGNRVMTSRDGKTWTLRASADDALSWEGIAYGSGTFVAVASSGTTNQIMSWSTGYVENAGASGLMYYDSSSGLVSYGSLNVNAPAAKFDRLEVAESISVPNLSITADLNVPGIATASSIITTSATVATLSTTNLTASANVNFGRQYQRSFAVTLPQTTNSTADICTFSFTPYIAEVYVMNADAFNKTSRKFVISEDGRTGATWNRVLPIATDDNDDFALEMTSSALRLKRVGTGSLVNGDTYTCIIRVSTDSIVNIIQPSGGTVTVGGTAVSSIVHYSTPFTQVNNRVGINTHNPTQALTVVGNIFTTGNLSANAITARGFGGSSTLHSLAVDGSMRHEATESYTFLRTLDSVESNRRICNISGRSFMVELKIMQGETQNNSIAHVYTFSCGFQNDTNAAWKRLLPVSSSMYRPQLDYNDIGVDIMVSSNPSTLNVTANLRLVRTYLRVLATDFSDANVYCDVKITYCKPYGLTMTPVDTSDFNYTTLSDAEAKILSNLYQGTLITSRSDQDYGGVVGIGTDFPDNNYLLDVNGSSRLANAHVDTRISFGNRWAIAYNPTTQNLEIHKNSDPNDPRWSAYTVTAILAAQ